MIEDAMLISVRLCYRKKSSPQREFTGTLTAVRQSNALSKMSQWHKAHNDLKTWASLKGVRGSSNSTRHLETWSERYFFDHSSWVYVSSVLGGFMIRATDREGKAERTERQTNMLLLCRMDQYWPVLGPQGLGIEANLNWRLLGDN